MGDNRTPVTVIGLGDMGAALAGAFLAQGHQVTVWNRTAAKADGLVARGAVRAGTVGDAVTASPLVIVCVLDYGVVEEVLAPVGGALAGRTVVNLTNGTPEQARRTAAWADEHGIGYLDGGIMAVPPGIGTAEAFLLHSGPREVFDAWREELAVLGRPEYAGADPGAAALQDLALLTGMYGMLAGVVQALALVRSAGFGPVDFATAKLVPWLSAMTAAVPHYAGQIESGDYTKGVVSNLAMQAAGLENIFRAHEEQDVSTELLAPVRALVARRVAEGHGTEDFPGVAELLGGSGAGSEDGSGAAAGR
ncbi:dehydrogenase [Streptomyces chrestomyceticus JCM 4735]|uniref:Dehydrogenase n=1 Tax=Streptomyces chrestomyceticus JCM 4735 TaxID=1306181 RepID=A0A7U9KVZ9_9ACTN|nr:NAD(P)-binding domain-containing protein [Streptomyces chrestomyceticus]GCD35788.1 dehydrogenase [Streptomyces chrestomyceticus JCM 4735]